MGTVQSGSLADRQDCTGGGSEEVRCPSLLSQDFLGNLHLMETVVNIQEIQTQFSVSNAIKQ